MYTFYIVNRGYTYIYLIHLIPNTANFNCYVLNKSSYSFYFFVYAMKRENKVMDTMYSKDSIGVKLKK